MIEMVSKLIEPTRRQTDWDEKLQLALFAYRSTPHSSTGESPNMLMLGREANMPIDLQMEQPLPDEHDTISTDYALNLRHDLSMAYERARKQLKRSAVRQKTGYDRNLSGSKVSKGDFVWLSKKSTKKGMSPKLDMRWEGPFLVIDKLSDVVYRIQRNGPRGMQKVVHFDRLKKYCGKPLQSWLTKKQPVQVEEIQPKLTLKDPNNETENSEKLLIQSDHEDSDQLPVRSHVASEDDVTKSEVNNCVKDDQSHQQETLSDDDGHPHQDEPYQSRDKPVKRQPSVISDEPYQSRDKPAKPPSVNSAEALQKHRYPQREKKKLPQRYR
jgi:hypothetical protein